MAGAVSVHRIVARECLLHGVSSDNQRARAVLELAVPVGGEPADGGDRQGGGGGRARRRSGESIERETVGALDVALAELGICKSDRYRTHQAGESEHQKRAHTLVHDTPPLLWWVSGWPAARYTAVDIERSKMRTTLPFR